MACAIAREVRDGETVAVGTLAPIPASGVLLAHFTHAPRATVVILNHPDFWPFSNGSKEFYDYAQRGKFDLFFLSGGQIDRHGNLNLITVGDHARPTVRFPGGAGAAMLYYLPRRVIVFRAEHTPRSFVERVDTVASPGSSPPDASVSTTERLVTQLAARREVYIFPQQFAAEDYVLERERVIATTPPDVFSAKAFEVVARADGWVLLRRGR